MIAAVSWATWLHRSAHSENKKHRKAPSWRVETIANDFTPRLILLLGTVIMNSEDDEKKSDLASSSCGGGEESKESDVTDAGEISDFWDQV